MSPSDVLGTVQPVEVVVLDESNDETDDDNLISCDRCGDMVDADGAVTVGQNEWCTECADDYSSTCCHCDERFSDYNMNTIDQYEGTAACDSCFNNHYTSCDSCGCTLAINDCFSDDYGAYCEDCYDERRSSSNEHIHKYDHKPEPIFHGGAGVIHYGVELEVDCCASYAEDVVDTLGGDRHVYLKEDSSIDNGFEIVTHPHTLDAHGKLWAPFFGSANLIGAMSAYDNGMHVHIQRRYLSRLQLQKMVIFINRRDHAEFVEFMADRSVGKWAAVDPYKANFNYKAYSNDRYTALNLTNPRTAEVRIFRGTLDRERFMANLQFCDALVTFCGTTGCRELSVPEFAAHVRKWGKRYRQLDNLLTEGGYLPPRNQKPTTGGSANNAIKGEVTVCV